VTPLDILYAAAAAWLLAAQWGLAAGRARPGLLARCALSALGGCGQDRLGGPACEYAQVA
jgi:hypothetical protein